MEDPWIVHQIGDMKDRCLRWSFFTLETSSEDRYLSRSSIEDPLDHSSPWRLRQRIATWVDRL